jgi:hypothetical protein
MPLQETSGAASYDAFGSPASADTYIEDVFSNTVYTGQAAYTSVTVATSNNIVTTNSTDPDFASVKRLLPLINTNAYDVITNTSLGGNLLGGSSLSNPFGQLASMSTSDNTDRSSLYNQPSGANYNGSWCIEGWGMVGASGVETSSAFIHSWDTVGAPPDNGVSIVLNGNAGSPSVDVSVRKNATATNFTSVSASLGTWYFISLSYNGSSLLLHVNGTLQETISFSNWTTQPTHQILMGSVASAAGASARFCQYRATFGSARASTRTTVPTRPFPTTGSPATCRNALVIGRNRTSAANWSWLEVDSCLQLWTNLAYTKNLVSIYSPSIGANQVTFPWGSLNTGSTENNLFYAFNTKAKFFDIVTYTGTGANRTVAHSLGSVPGCIIVKRIDGSTANWQVYHRSLANTQYLTLNTTDIAFTGATRWNSTTPTDTVFSLGTDVSVNASGSNYIAYLFAHDAGGFGASGTDNVITCGTYTGNGSPVTPVVVTLGYEPQWLLVKSTTLANQAWQFADAMRGMSYKTFFQLTNAATAELDTTTPYFVPTATGFNVVTSSGEVNGNGQTYVYVAIRRGPMKTPTTGTSVFSPNTFTTNDVKQTTGFPVDALIGGATAGGANTLNAVTRLQGLNTIITSGSPWPRLITSSTADETSISGTNIYYGYDSSGYLSGGLTGSTANVAYSFRRAPGFCDVVCYTGTGSATTFNHNLKVVPEMMIVKRRDTSADWWVYDTATGNTKYQVLNSTAIPVTASTAWNNTTPTSSVFTVGTGTPVNASAGTYVAYLFATVPRVSKVFSYTGNGTSQTINCGFTGGARFVMIKRTDAAGDWYVWDSASGIVAGNDPHMSLNSTAAQVTTDDSVDTDSTGFVVNQVAATNVNVTSATYIGLAIA